MRSTIMHHAGELRACKSSSGVFLADHALLTYPLVLRTDTPL
jgi:hypothetical protein